MRWLSAAWALFVMGGLIAGWGALQNFRQLALARPTSPMVAVAQPAAAPSPPPEASAPRAPLDDSADNLPPFAAAGQSEPPPHLESSSPAGRITVLLMGIDQRPDEAVPGGDPGRTDSMLLVSVDYDAHTASMVSIPRDGFVVIPGQGQNRVNAAYTLGEIQHPGTGPELAKRTIASIFSVPVDRYALVDVHSLEQIINTLGGVRINVPKRLVDTAYPTDDYRTMVVDIPAGPQLMNGVTAVQYARMRHPDSDYGRQARQQQLLLALRDAAMQLDNLPRLPQLIPQLLHLVRTDLTPAEIAQLVGFGRGLAADRDIVTLAANPQLTPSYTGPGGAAYINLTPPYRTAVRGLIEQPRVAAERAEIAVYNAGAPSGSGGRAATLLGRVGLVVNTITTTQRVDATRIEAGSGARETGALIARALGMPAEALVLVGDSSTVQVLLGPDTSLPTG